MAKDGAAPYTEAAAAKITAAFARLGQRPRDEPVSVEARFRAAVAHMRLGFQEAGYDYDATIVRIVEDMQWTPPLFPPRSIVPVMIQGLGALTGECRAAQIDGPARFSPAAGAAIREFMRMERDRSPRVRP